MYGERGLVLRARLSRGRESGQIPIIISFLIRQKFLGVLIGLVTNEARGCLFWHVAVRERGVIMVDLPLQNASQFMLTPTSLGALLLSMQYKCLMGI